MKKILFLLVAVFSIGLTLSITSVSYAASTTHKHPVCAASCSCSGSSHSNLTWQAWANDFVLMNGNYYLEKDITLSSTKALDYNYVTYLCLNGHSITCDEEVFDIYSYRSLVITDCKGTGKIETKNGMYTIGNNRSFRIYNGTIVNSGDGSALMTCAGTNTYINGGRIESINQEAVYAQPGSKIQVMGGTVYGKRMAISGHANTSNSNTLSISGGTLSSENGWDTVDLQSGSLTMTGGRVEGNVNVYDDNGTTTVSGGTITGTLDSCSASVSITGGNMAVYLSGQSATISGGTFRGNCYFSGDSTTVSGGNFTACSSVTVRGKTWINGGMFNTIKTDDDPLYLSGVPEIDALELNNPNIVSAQNPDQSGSYGGDTIKLMIDGYYAVAWKDKDVLIKNVRSDAVANKFSINGDNSFRHLERINNNLAVRILPHGTWGSNVSWVLKNGTLTLSGTGAITYASSGSKYPWYSYQSQIKKIEIEPGITEITDYNFEYCEHVEEIIIPETVTKISLHAFNDCGSLKKLFIPSSVKSITGTSNTLNPAFIRCESLSDVYYLGTKDEWKVVTAGKTVTSSNSVMTLHFLQQCGIPATCTQNGKKPHYRFDDTSVYNGYYDENKNLISDPGIIPATGHTFGEVIQAKDADCENAGNKAYKLCTVCNKYFAENADKYSVDAKDSADAFTLPALDHDYAGVFTVDKKATCTEAGYKSRHCSRCESTADAIEIPARGHIIVDTTVETAATCTQAGVMNQKCSNAASDEYEGCDYITSREIPEEDHNYESVITAPTCTSEGYTTYTCACADSYVADRVDSLGHNEINHEAKAPTCTEIGWEAYVTCSRCDYTTYEEILEKGHDYKSAVTAPTCTTEGYTTYTCACGDTYVADKVNANGHKLTTLKAVAATCIMEGKTEGKQCTVCGTVTVAQKTVAKKVHSYKTVTTKATLTKNGKVENKCSVCGNVSKTTTVYYPKTIKLEYTSATYNGKTKTPTVTVKDYKGKTISKDYYTVKYASGRKSTGKYTVTITFKGKYSGTKTLYFNILPSKTSKITPTCSTTEIKASWKKVTGASGYKVELLNSKGKVVKKVTTTKTSYTFKKLSKVTTYKIRVTAYKTIDKKAAYSGISTTITTSTAPAKVSLSKVTAGSKAATPAWKTVSGASGYQVQYSTSSKFKSAKTATVSKGSSKKTTIKKLTKGKKYYFKVRAYKTVGNTKVYGAWSSVKSVKVK